jgi:mitochondrial fission protein ELM1
MQSPKITGSQSKVAPDAQTPYADGMVEAKAHEKAMVAACPLPPSVSAWVLSDGKAGHEAQTLGIAEALGLAPQLRRVAPRGLFAGLAPFGPIDPRDALSKTGSPVAPPYPHILIAAGRRTVPYLRRVRRASKGATFTIFVNDPRTGASTADVIVAPRHDALKGDNVIHTLTPANRITARVLAAARENPDPRIAVLPAPRVAMLIGGDSRHFRFTERDVARLAEIARALTAQGASIMATLSRRTPAPAASALRDEIRGQRAFLWDGAAENPYIPMLANAAAIIVTADSVNMLGEAAATGAPIYFYEPSGGHPKLTTYFEALEAHGAARRWAGALEHWSYEPINSTKEIAAAIALAYKNFRAHAPHGQDAGRALQCGA